MVLPQFFTLPLAQICAMLTNSAYDQFAQWVNQSYPSPSKFVWKSDGPSKLTYSAPLWANVVVAGFSNWEPFGFVASDGKGNSYVVFRGSMTTADDYDDGYFNQVVYGLVTNPSFGYVSDGFYSVYTTALSSSIASLRDSTNAALVKTNPQSVVVTGHSLGAALCTLTIPDVIYNLKLKLGGLALYNFASPRVGDPTFANGVNNLVPKGQPTALFRIVNTEDAVPTLPPAVSVNVYEHVATPVSFTAEYFTITGNHSMEDCYTYAINNPAQPQNLKPTFVNLVTGFVRERSHAPKALVVPAHAG